MLYKRDIELNSTYSLEDARNNLISICRKYGTRETDRHLFEGRIVDHEFTILPIFDYGIREQIRPEIHGQFIQKTDKLCIFLKFRMSQTIRFLYIITILVNTAFTVGILFLSKYIEFPLIKIWWIPLAMMVFLFFSSQIIFDMKASKAEKILKKIWGIN